MWRPAHGWPLWFQGNSNSSHAKVIAVSLALNAAVRAAPDRLTPARGGNNIVTDRSVAAPCAGGTQDASYQGGVFCI